jgi:SAM-dependent methyltransferase
MSTVAENRAFWDETYDWQNAEDEWSAAWGGAKMQWYACLLPRLRACLPAKTVLEIAPGYGRWTQFLQPLCERLIVVDLSKRCIAACRERFSHANNIEYHVNDGRSLDFIQDHSLDLVFTFDSLVHADEETMAAYLRVLSKKLKEDGTAFIHHSNVGAYPKLQKALTLCPSRVKRALARVGLSQRFNLYGRDPKMSAPKFEALAEEAGLRVVSQEMVSCGGPGPLVDCISFVRTSGYGPKRVLENVDFTSEIRNARRLSRVYADELVPPRSPLKPLAIAIPSPVAATEAHR